MEIAERKPWRVLVASLVVLSLSVDSVGSASFAFAPPPTVLRGLPPGTALLKAHPPGTLPSFQGLLRKLAALRPAPAPVSAPADPEIERLWSQSRLGGAVPEGFGPKRAQMRSISFPDGRQVVLRRYYEDLGGGKAADKRSLEITYPDGRHVTLWREFGATPRPSMPTPRRIDPSSWQPRIENRTEDLGPHLIRHVRTMYFPDGRREVSESTEDTRTGATRTVQTEFLLDGSRRVRTTLFRGGPWGIRSKTTLENPDGTWEVEERECSNQQGGGAKDLTTTTFSDGGKTVVEGERDSMGNSRTVATSFLRDGRKKTRVEESRHFQGGGFRQTSTLTLGGWSRISITEFDPTRQDPQFSNRVIYPDGRRETVSTSIGPLRAGDHLVRTVTTYPDGSQEVQELDFNPARPMGQRSVTTFTEIDGRRRQTMTSPLVFDLDARGIRTAAARALFDMSGAGRPSSISALGSGVGVLVFDPRGEGVSGMDGRALFGDKSDIDGDGRPDGYRDGFSALRALVDKAVAQRVIPRSSLARHQLDAEDLARLEAAYGLKMKVGGLDQPAVSLKDAGVAGIFLSGRAPARIRDFDGRGNDLSTQQGAVFTRVDGTSGHYADIWFRCDPAPAAAASPLARSPARAALRVR